jgi:hypothetical protein
METKSYEHGAAEQQPKLWGMLLDSPIAEIRSEHCSGESESEETFFHLHVKAPDGKKYFLKVTYGIDTTESCLEYAPRNEKAAALIGRTVRDILNLPTDEELQSHHRWLP